jgi:ribose/xylose/arabinose/galactoside ABC-type transport system permease subunit
MMSAARGVAKWVSGEQKLNAGAETWISHLLSVDREAPWWKLPPGVLVLVVLAAATAVLLRFTIFGRYVFALGSNEATARLCGIRVRLQKVVIYTLAGLFVGVAGLMEFSNLNVGDPSGAQGKELQIIAAVVIGGGSLSGGRGSVLGTLIGAFIIGFLRNGCVMYDVPNTVQDVVIGAIIVAAAAVDQLQQRRRG